MSEDLFPSCTEEEANKRMMQAIPRNLIERWCAEADQIHLNKLRLLTLEECKSHFWMDSIPMQLLEKAKTENHGYKVNALVEILGSWIMEKTKMASRVSYVEEKVTKLLKMAEQEEISK